MRLQAPWADRWGLPGMPRLLIGAKSPYPAALNWLMEAFVVRAVIAKIVAVFGLILQADNLLEGSWQSRDWPTFVRTWLVTTVGVAVMAFLLPFLMFMLPALLYDLLALVMKTRTIPISFRDSLAFGSRFGGMVGLFFFVSVIPMMYLKQIAGDWKLED